MHFVRLTRSSIFLGNSRGHPGHSSGSGSQPPLQADAVTVGDLPRPPYSGEAGLLTRGRQKFQNCHDEATLAFIKRFQTALIMGTNGKRAGKGEYTVGVGGRASLESAGHEYLILTVCLIGCLLKLDLKGSLLWNLVFQCFLGCIG